jgi:hypothetical protein
VNRAKLLEAIVSALHTQAGFDNQSTTTAAYCSGNHTLYLTHQYNKRYEDLLRLAASRIFTLSSEKQMMRIDPLVRKNIEEAESIKKKPFGALVKDVLKFRVSIADEQEKADFRDFLDEIQAIKVVLDSDLFIRSEYHSGFHGESRIIRFLYIKYLKRISFEEMEHPEQGTVERFKTDFKARYGNVLWMGSSQGACTYCAKMMNALDITYYSDQGTNKDRDGTWRHPLTTTTKMNDFGPPVVSGLLATNAAFKQGVYKGPKG